MHWLALCDLPVVLDTAVMIGANLTPHLQCTPLCYPVLYGRILLMSRVCGCTIKILATTQPGTYL
eukprot:SAG31_NODE_4003_length_3674_cov_7.299860_5_plen_65_part_00